MKNYCGSVLFASIFVGICKYTMCKAKNISKKDSGHVGAWCGICASLSLFLENNSRRQEISLFMTPKFLELLWNYLRITYVKFDV